MGWLVYCWFDFFQDLLYSIIYACRRTSVRSRPVVSRREDHFSLKEGCFFSSLSILLFIPRSTKRALKTPLLLSRSTDKNERSLQRPYLMYSYLLFRTHKRMYSVEPYVGVVATSTDK